MRALDKVDPQAGNSIILLMDACLEDTENSADVQNEMPGLLPDALIPREAQDASKGVQAGATKGSANLKVRPSGSNISAGV